MLDPELRATLFLLVSAKKRMDKLGVTKNIWGEPIKNFREIMAHNPYMNRNLIPSLVCPVFGINGLRMADYGRPPTQATNAQWLPLCLPGVIVATCPTLHYTWGDGVIGE